MRQRAVVSAAGAAVAVYAALWIGWVQGWAWPNAADHWLLAELHPIGAAHPLWVSFWRVFCTVFGPAGWRLIGLAVVVWLLARRDVRGAVFVAVSVELSSVVTLVAKHLANRSRPSTALAHPDGSSFPSGHALGVTVAVLALLTVALPMLAARWRRPLMVLGAVLVLSVSFGRLALNVHYPTDVLAGWALGLLWYLACLTATVRTPAVPGSGS
jgi:membrane-associated phospholipid phosphatase